VRQQITQDCGEILDQQFEVNANIHNDDFLPDDSDVASNSDEEEDSLITLDDYWVL